MGYMPVLMLHQVDDNPPESLAGWSISRSQFTLLLDRIENNGFVTTTFKENCTSKSNDRKKVVLTFDDCASSLMEFAVPELIKRNMKAVFYIPSAHIGDYNKWDVDEQGFDKMNLLTGEQLRYLSENGMEIGSHGHKHRRLNSIDLHLVKEEINLSKQILEETINQPIYSFSYPYGEIPNNYQLLLKEENYSCAVSIYQAFQHKYAIRRIGIHNTDTIHSIDFKLSKKYQFFRSCLDPFLLIKKIFTLPR